MYSPKKLYSWLSLAQWWYNTNHHSAIKMSFFQALYGYAPPNREIVMQDSSSVEAVDEMLQVRTNTYHIFQKQLEATKSRMK